MKRYITRALLAFAVLFIALFSFRLIYGYMTQPNGQIINVNYYNSIQKYDFSLSRKNYAGQNNSMVGSGPASIDQRYEKVATLGQSSHNFDTDEARIREIADAAQAMIQHEQLFGLEGQRQLQLALGVPPDAFDDTIEELRQIGKPGQFQVNKSDKTNEYHALLAQQESLKKSRDNLVALKQRDAELSALIELEQQILMLEEQI